MAEGRIGGQRVVFRLTKSEPEKVGENRWQARVVALLSLKDSGQALANAESYNIAFRVRGDLKETKACNDSGETEFEAVDLVGGKYDVQARVVGTDITEKVVVEIPAQPTDAAAPSDFDADLIGPDGDPVIVVTVNPKPRRGGRWSVVILDDETGSAHTVETDENGEAVFPAATQRGIRNPLKHTSGIKKIRVRVNAKDKILEQEFVSNPPAPEVNFWGDLAFVLLVLYSCARIFMSNIYIPLSQVELGIVGQIAEQKSLTQKECDAYRKLQALSEEDKVYARILRGREGLPPEPKCLELTPAGSNNLPQKAGGAGGVTRGAYIWASIVWWLLAAGVFWVRHVPVRPFRRSRTFYATVWAMAGIAGQLTLVPLMALKVFSDTVYSLLLWPGWWSGWVLLLVVSPIVGVITLWDLFDWIWWRSQATLFNQRKGKAVRASADTAAGSGTSKAREVLKSMPRNDIWREFWSELWAEGGIEIIKGLGTQVFRIFGRR